MEYLLPRIPQQPAFDESLSLGIIQEELYGTTSRTRPGSPIYSQSGQSSSHDSSSNGTSPDSTLPNKRPRINYECDACGTTYTEKRALARHRHTDMHRRRLGLAPDKRYTCLKCGRSFGRNHDLQRHRREQHGEATGASAVDLSSISCGASDGSENRSLSSEDSTARSISAASVHSAMTSTTAITVPDEFPAGPGLRAAQSHGDFRTRSSESQDSKPGAMDWSQATTSSNDPGMIIRAWPGEPEEDAFLPSYPAENCEAPKPARRHSSASLQMDDLDEISDTHGDIITPLQCDDSKETVPSTTKAFRRRPRETVLKSSIPIGRQTIEEWRPATCGLCGNIFEQDDSLLEHLRKHTDSFKGKHRCRECQVKFDHEEDLIKHLDSAKKGHCGFKFEHAQPCTGHHPPAQDGNNINILPDSDAFRLCYQLRDWEQAQLQAYIRQINELIAARDTSGKNRNRWSVEALMKRRSAANRNSSNSYQSFAISVNTYASAPCDEEDGKMDIGGLQSRMKFLSLKELGASVKHTISGGKYHPTKPLPPPQTYDKTLSRAIQRHDLKRATALLNSGDADPITLYRASGALVSAALWDDSEIQSHIVAHRITEDIQGSCDICHMNSLAFNKGSTNRVRALLAHGADPNAGGSNSPNKKTGGLCGYPLLSAAWMCNDKIVNMLLAAGARVNQSDDKFGSALGIAASQAGFPGSLEVVAVLLNHGADVEVRGSEGSVLQIAKRRREFWVRSGSGGGGWEIIAPEDRMARIDCTEEIIRGLEAAGAK